MSKPGAIHLGLLSAGLEARKLMSTVNGTRAERVASVSEQFKQWLEGEPDAYEAVIRNFLWRNMSDARLYKQFEHKHTKDADEDRPLVFQRR